MVSAPQNKQTKNPIATTRRKLRCFQDRCSLGRRGNEVLTTERRVCVLTPAERMVLLFPRNARKINVLIAIRHEIAAMESMVTNKVPTISELSIPTSTKLRF